MRRIVTLSLLLMAMGIGAGFFAMRSASAQFVPNRTKHTNSIEIFDKNGGLAGKIKIVDNTLTVVSASGVELYRSAAAAPSRNLPLLEPPSVDSPADTFDDINSLRRAIDALAGSVTKLTERVNQLSQQ